MKIKIKEINAVILKVKSMEGGPFKATMCEKPKPNEKTARKRRPRQLKKRITLSFIDNPNPRRGCAA